MKKILKTLSVLGFGILVSCTNNENSVSSEATAEVSSTTLRRCASYEVLEAQLAADPTLRARMDKIEDFTNKRVKDFSRFRIENGQIVIPVVVNVLYNTTAENISDAQIQSQIDVLNEDYNGTNADFSNVPTAFSNVKAAVGIKFVLQGIVRKKTTKKSWRTDDSMKKSTKGGIDPTTPSTVLNLWCVNSMGDILGYAQFPGGSSATDGVVIAYKYFGRIGTVQAPYNLGRTATHEVGHWMNLRHIWGDTTCGDDYVADTPSHNAANYGTPAYPHYSTCTGTPIEMTMNYMDYVDDKAMYMFSADQKTRMLAIFTSGGPRASFAK